MRRAAVLLALLAALALAAPAHADDDQIVITGDVEVRARRDGRATWSSSTVACGSTGRVTGDVVAVSAPVRINGPVEGDVVTIAERVLIGPGGRVDGDVTYGDKDPVITVPGAVGGKTEKLDFDEFISPLGMFAAWVALWLAVSRLDPAARPRAAVARAAVTGGGAARSRGPAPGPRSASGSPCSSGCRRWPCC